MQNKFIGDSWSDSTGHYLVTLAGLVHYDYDELKEFEADKVAIEDQIKKGTERIEKVREGLS